MIKCILSYHFILYCIYVNIINFVNISVDFQFFEAKDQRVVCKASGKIDSSTIILTGKTRNKWSDNQAFLISLLSILSYSSSLCPFVSRRFKMFLIFKTSWQTFHANLKWFVWWSIFIVDITDIAVTNCDILEMWYCYSYISSILYWKAFLNLYFYFFDIAFGST